MTVSVLGCGGYSRAPFGSFAGKLPSVQPPPVDVGAGHGSDFIFPAKGPILAPHGKKLNRKQRRELERALAESLRTQTEIAPDTLKTLIKLPSFSEIAALEEDDLNIRLLLLDS